MNRQYDCTGLISVGIQVNSCNVSNSVLAGVQNSLCLPVPNTSNDGWYLLVSVLLDY